MIADLTGTEHWRKTLHMAERRIDIGSLSFWDFCQTEWNWNWIKTDFGIRVLNSLMSWVTINAEVFSFSFAFASVDYMVDVNEPTILLGVLWLSNEMVVCVESMNYRWMNINAIFEFHIYLNSIFFDSNDNCCTFSTSFAKSNLLNAHNSINWYQIHKLLSDWRYEFYSYCGAICCTRDVLSEFCVSVNYVLPNYSIDTYFNYLLRCTPQKIYELQYYI